jgi:hypothetical protein
MRVHTLTYFYTDICQDMSGPEEFAWTKGILFWTCIGTWAIVEVLTIGGT